MKLTHSNRHKSRYRHPHVFDIEDLYETEHTETELEERALKARSFSSTPSDAITEDFDPQNERIRMNPLDRYFSSWL
jgi:hypothetical protein